MAGKNECHPQVEKLLGCVAVHPKILLSDPILAYQKSLDEKETENDNFDEGIGGVGRKKRIRTTQSAEDRLSSLFDVSSL